MTKLSANRGRLSYIAESTPGTTPSGTLTNLRLTSDGLKQTTNYKTSSEIRADRAVAARLRTSFQAGGSLGFEMLLTAFDPLILAALYASAWEADVTVTGTDISAAAADNSFNSGSAAFGSLVVGQWVRVSGFTGTNTTANGYFKIESKPSSSKIIVSGATLVNDSAGESVTIKQLEYAVNGTTLSTFSFERAFTDASNRFAVFPYGVMNGFSLSGSAEDIITGSFDVVARKEVSNTATVGSGPNDDAPTVEAINASDHVARCLVNGASFDISGFGFSLNNNARARKKVGFRGVDSFGDSSFEASASLEAYYDDSSAFAAIYDSYLSDTAVSFALAFEDDDQHGLVIELPSAKILDASRVLGGINQDVTVPFSLGSFIDPTDGVVIKVART